MQQVWFLEENGEKFLLYEAQTIDEAVGFVYGRFGNRMDKNGVERIFIIYNGEVMFSWRI